MAIWITSSYPDCAAEVKINQIVQPHVQLKSLALMHNQLPPNHKRHKELECPHKLKLPGHQFQGIITSKQLNDYGVHEELFFFHNLIPHIPHPQATTNSKRQGIEMS